MEKKKNRCLSVITCIVFLMLIFGFTIADLLAPVKAFSENENRFLAARPEFSKEALFKGQYTKKYEEFITDQFVARDHWIGIKTLAERAMLKQDINGVFFAEGGYLIEKHSNADIDKEQAAKNQERLLEFVQKYSQELGDEHIKVMLVPTASEILKDKLPPYAPGYDQNGLIEEVKAAVNKINGGFVDIRDCLKEHKEEAVYYRTDHHWTSLGAYYAYRQWAEAAGFEPWEQERFSVEKVTGDFYGTIFSKVNVNVTPDDINIYKTKEATEYFLDYNMGEKTSDTLYDWEQLKGKDKYAVFMGGNNAIVQVDTKVDNGRKLLVIKDSFAHSLVPFAVNHFERTFMIDFRYFNAGVEQYIKDNGITDVLVLYNTINFAQDKNTGNFIK